jgi:hypothetical protein
LVFVGYLDNVAGRIPSPTGDLSQGIRVRGRWRWWATTALVRRDRWEGGGGRATVPARVLSREQGGGDGELGLALEAANL